MIRLKLFPALLLTIVTFLSFKPAEKLAFNGFYRHEVLKDNNKIIYEYLKFYENGLVVSVKTTITDLKTLERLMSSENEKVQKTFFILKGNNLSFEILDDDQITKIIFKGKLSEDKLAFKVKYFKSTIVGAYKATYDFVPLK